MPKLCIHGHFYQPPRIDPWLGDILPEPSAAPYTDWNDRITQESYGPLAFARSLNNKGEIELILNSYEWISFNFGPTLLSWMERHAPTVYSRVIQADKKSVSFFGHGNAMAQTYHHTILPLATPLDRELEIHWAVLDFIRRYGRRPEGIWLPEAAVDTATLESIVSAGLTFTVLAPRQAKAVADHPHGPWHSVNEDTVDTTEPYRVSLPSGRSLAVFLYNGPVSRAVAFERLLADGETFWQRLTANRGNGFQCIATDGESYGHHFKFGEMALAYALRQAQAKRNDWELTNFATLLAAHPPRRELQIHEASSWSCVHGVKRWQEHCGCSDGGHGDWTQHWRGPLRQALNTLKSTVDEHFFRAGESVFVNPKQALLDFGLVLTGTLSKSDFTKTRLLKNTSNGQQETAFQLLSMQRWALASFASCAWFFDDLARIEPLNGLTFALKAMEDMKAAQGPDMEKQFVAILAQARSNDSSLGDGAALWERFVKPRQLTSRTIAGLGVGLLPYGRPAGRHEWSWPEVDLELRLRAKGEGYEGTALIRRPFSGEDQLALAFVPDAHGNVDPSHLSVDGKRLSIDILGPRVKRMLARMRIRAEENSLWTETEARTAACARILLASLERPDEPLDDFQLMGPLVAWLWIVGEIPDSKTLQEYLVQTMRRDPLLVRLLCCRCAERILFLLENSNPDFEAMVRIIHRARFLGVEPDRWAIQNRIWVMDGQALRGPVATLLNFAPIS